jgi:hypothetical protein
MLYWARSVGNSRVRLREVLVEVLLVRVGVDAPQGALTKARNLGAKLRFARASVINVKGRDVCRDHLGPFTFRRPNEP